MASFPLLAVAGSPSELEIATAVLHDHGCLGTEEDGGVLRAYFAESTNVGALAAELRQSLPSLQCRVLAPIPGRDWLAEWKAELQGFAIGSRYFVLPTWKPDIETTRTVLRIDPEQAFGTGTHETTQLCVELVEDYVSDGLRVLDVGAGTGILSMVAAHENAASVRAVDIDPAAVECARANIERNGLSSKVTVECAGWEDIAPIKADIVVANINTTVLTRAVGAMFGTLLLSGVLVEDADELTLPDGAEVVEKRIAGEWAALVIRHG